MDFSLIDLFALLAQESEEAIPPGPSFVDMLLPLAIIFVLYVFFIQRPQRRQQMERENSMNALKKGDKVVTIGGICGKVEHVDKTTGRVTLLVDKNSRIEFVRAAIERIDRPTGEAKGGGKEEAAASEAEEPKEAAPRKK